MGRRTRTRTAAVGRAAAVAATLLLIAGCGSAATTKSSAQVKPASGSNSMPGMKMAPGSKMNMSKAGAAETKAAGKAVTVDGITAVPTQMLATAKWQGMKIQAMAMTPVPFVVYNGTSEREIKPTKQTSFHLMVELNDAVTNEPIPYAEVWATIRKNGKLISDERTWPMISRYIGPHYGEDVSVPGPGTYQLSLLVTPPLLGRHMEYANVWKVPHTVNVTFHWQPPGT